MELIWKFLDEDNVSFVGVCECYSVFYVHIQESINSYQILFPSKGLEKNAQKVCSHSACWAGWAELTLFSNRICLTLDSTGKPSRALHCCYHWLIFQNLLMLKEFYLSLLMLIMRLEEGEDDFPSCPCTFHYFSIKLLFRTQ